MATVSATTLPLTESDPESVASILKSLTEPDHNSQQFRDSLQTILYATNYADFTAILSGDQNLTFIDTLDQALDHIPPDTDFSRKCLRALRKMCGQTRVLPSSHMLSDGLQKSGDIAAASGTFADVWTGTYYDRDVAIKALRIYHADELRTVQKQLFKEAVIWRRLSHPNVLTFLGISTTVFRLCIVSEWMPHGHITHYLANNPTANRLALILDVANGLQYLHSSQVVHGSLKAHNIFINNAGRACIADFGLTSVTNDPLSVNASTAGVTHGSARWMAPELLNPDQDTNRPTEASDVYAFAMVVVEIFSGNLPFHQFRNQLVIFRVMDGKRPERPANALKLGLSDELWDMMHRCWHQDASERPAISVVVELLERLINPERHVSERAHPSAQPSDANGVILKGSGGVPQLRSTKPPPKVKTPQLEEVAPAIDKTTPEYSPQGGESCCCVVQ